VKLRAVILDWAGTVVDYGSRAPVAALESVFSAVGVPVTVTEVRESMGIAKKAHIQSILEIARVRGAWASKYGSEPTGQDVDKLYAAFIPNQIQVLADYSELIPGAANAVARMRSRGLRIGTTTGYNRAMLDYLLERGAAQGFAPDSALCPGDAGAGRPLPWMCYLAAIKLEVYPMATMVKIGDTPADVQEGRNAGMWTIGVTRTGNEVGLTEGEWAGLSEDEQAGLLHTAERRLLDSGAHYIAPGVADCDAILDQIEARLAAGEKP
jgi:phosphonoacetaldehyde hydrolase